MEVTRRTGLRIWGYSITILIMEQRSMERQIAPWRRCCNTRSRASSQGKLFNPFGWLPAAACHFQPPYNQALTVLLTVFPAALAEAFLPMSVVDPYRVGNISTPDVLVRCGVKLLPCQRRKSRNILRCMKMIRLANFVKCTIS